MELRDVDLRSVGHSVQKLWPTTFFAKKMPCILHGAEKKIRDTISRQVSGLAQLPDDLKSIVDQESNTYKSGGETWSILCLSTGQCFTLISREIAWANLFRGKCLKMFSQKKFAFVSWQLPLNVPK